MTIKKIELGTNQYAKRVRFAGLRPNQWASILSAMSMGFVIVGFSYYHHTMQAIRIKSPIAYADYVTDTPVRNVQVWAMPTPASATAHLDDQTKIENYVRTIFGSDATVAIAISHAECSPQNPYYPACDHTITSQENSVGIFQINLYNKDQWIHAGRIPGDTMQEKVKWLSDPYNNTLYAYWVFKTSGFTPWSTFQNGAYKANL